MRLHTDTLTERDIYEAGRLAGVTFDVLAWHGSRTRRRAFEVKLLGSSSSRPNMGTSSGDRFDRDEFAATWDEWGIFLGALFAQDPRMIAGGPNGYVGATDYHWQTGGRFDRRVNQPDHIIRVLSPAEQHRRHHWTYTDWTYTGGSSARGYAMHTCPCGAVKRFLTGGATRESMGLDVPERADVHA